MAGIARLERGLEALRRAVLLALRPAPAPPRRRPAPDDRGDDPGAGPAGSSGSGRIGDEDQAVSSEDDAGDRERMIALVELARAGDKDAFGLLYDHYHVSVYRFLFYRTRSQALAEDLTSETFFRALRSMNNFRWQGKDFGAWLMTIARNLATDHFKAGRTRLELTTEDMSPHDDATEGPESAVLASLTNEVLLTALSSSPPSSASASSCGSCRACPSPRRRWRSTAPAAPSSSSSSAAYATWPSCCPRG